MIQAADNLSDWPELLRRVAEACGGGVALSLASAYGGRELYVPQAEAIGEDHPLAVTLGLAAARQVAEVLSSGKIVIPMGPTSTPARRAALIRRLRREGHTHAAIAQAASVHERSVYRSLSGSRDDRSSSTLDMFEDI